VGTDQGSTVVEGLFETHFQRVYRFVRRSSDPATAEEVAHEVFVKLLSRGEALSGKPVSASYLIKIADNMLKRRFRRGERAREVLSGLARRRPAEGDDGARGAAASDSVLHAFDRLTSEEQEAVRLIVCEGLSYRDAATAMGVRVTTVNNWKHRGIERLRKEAEGRRRVGR
jgi:RNA polymerase sigma-70 factor, ECF subfamily